MEKFRFNILANDQTSCARVGEIITTHGTIRTPAFVPVGTAATIKSLTSAEIRACNIDVFFVNTYHMLFRPGIPIVKKMGGLHSFMNWGGPIMTDSGGFQAFSLGEFGLRKPNVLDAQQLVRITDTGIYFRSAWDGTPVYLDAKTSIQAQQDLDSDIMMSFDECTFYPVTKKRAQEALTRTHRWAQEGLIQRKKKQSCALYGIVQGSIFEDLRKTSAQYIAHLPFDGFAVGSVANSKEPREKVFAVLDWTLPLLLSHHKPIHFLGIGEVEDIILSIEKGIDSLDCVIPTRMARMGWIFAQKMGRERKFRYDIIREEFETDKKQLEETCSCLTCTTYTRGYLHHLFRSRELLGYRLATIHNLSFFGRLMQEAREAITTQRWKQFKKSWLA